MPTLLCIINIFTNKEGSYFEKVNNDEFNKFIESIDFITTILSNSALRETNSRKKLSDIDNKLQDLLHEAELSQLSRREKLNLSNSIIEERQNRRRIKNTLEILEPCTKLANNTHYQVVAQLGALSTKLKNILSLQNKRVYTARCNTELKVSKEKIHKKL